MADLTFSLAVLATLALLAGGAVLWRRRGERRKGVLMIVAALVVLANVALLSLPAPSASTGQHR